MQLILLQLFSILVLLPLSLLVLLPIQMNHPYHLSARVALLFYETVRDSLSSQRLRFPRVLSPHPIFRYYLMFPCCY